MTAPAHPTLAAADALCSALDQIGDALVDLDLGALLATEGLLASLVATMPIDPVTGRDGDELTVLLQRARVSLLRCRRLGASFSAIARPRLQACAEASAYGPGGECQDRSAHSTV